MIQGEYGTFFRNDGRNLYILLTNAGDQNGSYNDFRPLTINLSTGQCDINGRAVLDGSGNNIAESYVVKNHPTFNSGIEISGDLPYIPQLCTILAAKDAPGEVEGEPLSYSSASVNNAWGKDGNFSYGSWVFIIHEAFEPAAYYDIQLHGYEKPLAQAEVIEIPIQQ